MALPHPRSRRYVSVRWLSPAVTGTQRVTDGSRSATPGTGTTKIAVLGTLATAAGAISAAPPTIPAETSPLGCCHHRRRRSLRCNVRSGSEGRWLPLTDPEKNSVYRRPARLLSPDRGCPTAIRCRTHLAGRRSGRCGIQPSLREDDVRSTESGEGGRLTAGRKYM